VTLNLGGKKLCRQPLVDNDKENGKNEIFKGGFVFFLSLFFVKSSVPSRKVALLRAQESFLRKNSKKKGPKL